MSERIYQDHVHSGRGQTPLAEFAWTSDACEKCGPEHYRMAAWPSYPSR